MAFDKSKGEGGVSGGSLPPKVINVAADYPTEFEANRDMGRHYYIGSSPSVTDNDPTKTNTGQTFLQGQDFLWDGISAYFLVGDDPILNQHERFTALGGDTSFTILGPTPVDPVKLHLVGNHVAYYYGVDFTISENVITWITGTGRYVPQVGDLFDIWYNSSTASIKEIGFTARVDLAATNENVTGDGVAPYIVIFDTVIKDSGYHGLAKIYDPVTGTAIVPIGAYSVSAVLYFSGLTDNHDDLSVEFFSVTDPSEVRRIDPRDIRFDVVAGVGKLLISDSSQTYFDSQRTHSIRIIVGGDTKTVSILTGSRFAMYKL